MKRTFFKRGLTLFLSLLMIAGLFSVCTVSAEGTRELPMKIWGPRELAENATAVGTMNKHDSPIFTTYTQAIGRRSTIADGCFIHNARVQHVIGDEMQFRNGDSVLYIVRLIADEGYSEGLLCTLDLGYALNEYVDEYRYSFDITFEDYDAAFTQIDPVYGYEYKEFSFIIDLIGEIFDDPEENSMEMRAMSKNNDYATTIFSMELIDMNDKVLAKYEGQQLASVPGHADTYETIYTNETNPAGIISYVGHDHAAIGWRSFNPYALYSADGQIELGEPGAVLVDGLGQALDAGTYSFTFSQSTMYSLGVKKVTYIVTDKTAGTEVARLFVDKAMIDATVGSDSGTFEDRSIQFTVTEENAGHEFVFSVVLYNQTDYRLRSATLNLVVDADTELPAEVQAVLDLIDSIDLANPQTVTDARTAYDALDTLGQAWVGVNAKNKLTTYEKALEDATAVINAIDALGDKAEITAQNYTEKTEALEAAEALYQQYSQAYGSEIADTTITNAQALTDYRAACDTVAEEILQQAKDTAVAEVEEAIEALGSAEDINKDNLAEKQAALDEVKAAMQELVNTYGEEVLAEIDNADTLEAIEDKIEELSAVEEYTLGDINADGNIDAADALKALQHAVALVTLDGVDFLAADVNRDSNIDAVDALLILQYAVNLISGFAAA